MISKRNTLVVPATGDPIVATSACNQQSSDTRYGAYNAVPVAVDMLPLAAAQLIAVE